MTAVNTTNPAQQLRIARVFDDRDTAPTCARHRRVLLLGCVLSVARIPWLRAPITTRAKWPADGMRQRVTTTSEDQR